MNWKSIRKDAGQLRRELRDLLNAKVSPALTTSLILILFTIQTCSTTEVRIILENNGAPVVVKQIRTSKIIQTKPLKVVASKKEPKVEIIASANAQPITAYHDFKVGDCIASASDAAGIIAANGVEDWEIDNLTVMKINKIGRARYRYNHWDSSDKEWFENHWTKRLSDLGEYHNKVPCPKS